MKCVDRKLGINFSLKTLKDGKWISICRTHSGRRFLHKFRHVSAEKYHLIVTYAPGVYNDGIYENKKDLLHAFECFSNQDDVKFIAQYNGLKYSK